MMRAIKDKKKFGWNKIPKNHLCKVFGYCYGKEARKQIRREERSIGHKLLKHIPLTESEIEEVLRKHKLLEMARQYKFEI